MSNYEGRDEIAVDFVVAGFVESKEDGVRLRFSSFLLYWRLAFALDQLFGRAEIRL